MSTGSATLLQMDGVGRSFGGVHAVAQLSLTVEAGAITGLIGPNGAGKTTVVNLVSGLLRVDEGHIRFDGHDITHDAPYLVARRGIARTFQNIRLLKNETVLTNILAGFHTRDRVGSWTTAWFLPSALAARRKSEAQALAMLEDFGMAEYADYPAKALSYGHQRRVEIIRALASGPKLLMLDEPAAGMNDPEADEIGALMRKLASAGLAVLLIEHNMRLVMSVCDTIHAMETGRHVVSGSPAEVAANRRVIDAYLGT